MTSLPSLMSLKLAVVLSFATPLFGSVTVSSPLAGTSDAAPVHYAASASTGTCAAGVASVGIYVNNQLKYVQHGRSLSTDLSLAPGSYHTVVQAWDNCGGASGTVVDFTVGGPDFVAVTSPASGSEVSSPVTYIADASTSICATGIASMGVYVGNSLKYVVNGTHLNTQLPLASGPQSTVVQTWDNCGGSSHVAVPLTIGTPPAQAPVKHVFVITLENKGFAETFGANSQAPYLSQTLTGQGQLLNHYYGIGHNSLDNYVAMISGQAPDSATQGDCHTYQDFNSAREVAADGQIVGQGCVYPTVRRTHVARLHGRYVLTVPACCAERIRSLSGGQP